MSESNGVAVVDLPMVPVADESFEVVESTQTEAGKASAALATSDPATDAALAKEAASMDRVVAKNLKLYNDGKALKSHAETGKVDLEHCIMVKRDVRKAWKSSFFDEVMAEIKKRTLATVPAVDMRPDNDVYAYAFVEAMKPVVPSVENLSYRQVINKFVPAALSFSKKDLAFSIRDGWVEKTRELIERQLSSAPLKMDDLDIEIAKHGNSLKSAAKGTTLEAPASPNMPTLSDVKAKTKAENAARSKLSTAIAETAKLLRPAEMIAVLDKAGVTLPSPVVKSGVEASTMTAAQAKAFVAELLANHNSRAILVIFTELRPIVEQIKAEMIASSNSHATSATLPESIAA